MKTFENVIMPEYYFDEDMKVDREKECPPRELFKGLGWDKDKDEKKKHYRRFYAEELEKVKDLIPKESPFNSYQIMRG